MLDDFGPRPEASSEYINVFTEHYSKLLAAARSFFNNDHGRAIDLVHDALIEFARYSPDLHKINNLDGYLRRLMYNLFKSQRRQIAFRSVWELSIDNYDLGECSLPEIANRYYNPHLLLRLQDTLRVICEYACFRKEKLKIGSALILRFFHGYHTSEIAQIMGVTASAVSHQLKLAQAEVSLYLQDPKHSDFYHDITSVQGRYKLNFGYLVEDIVEELRNTIFGLSSCHECILHFNLHKLYGNQCRKEVNYKTLAHIVSCVDCLDTVNSILGIELLSVRYPADMLNRRAKIEDKSHREAAMRKTISQRVMSPLIHVSCGDQPH